MGNRDKRLRQLGPIEAAEQGERAAELLCAGWGRRKEKGEQRRRKEKEKGGGRRRRKENEEEEEEEEEKEEEEEEEKGAPCLQHISPSSAGCWASAHSRSVLPAPGQQSEAHSSGWHSHSVCPRAGAAVSLSWSCCGPWGTVPSCVRLSTVKQQGAALCPAPQPAPSGATQQTARGALVRGRAVNH